MPLFCPPTKSTRRPPCPKTNPNWLSLSRGCSQNIKKSNRRLIISPQAPSEAVPFKGFGEFFFPNFVLLCNGCVLHFDSGSQSVCHQLLPAGVGPRWLGESCIFSLLSVLQELLVFSAFIGDPTVQVVHVSHNVTAFEFFYEPFYVSLDSAPLYDERFEGYGFTRNTQVETMIRGFLKTWGKFGTLSGLRAPLGWVELPGEKKLEFYPRLKPSESTNNPPLKICPHNQMFFFKGSLASVHCALGPCQEEGAPNMEGKVLLQMCTSNWFLFPQAKLKQQEEVGSFWWIW